MSRSLNFCALALLVLMLGGCKAIGNAFDETPNIGPCPAALVLWDASRKVEFNGPESYKNIVFTAEILGARSFCKYSGDRPITADLDVAMAFGRGPAATTDTKVYHYFVAVTRKNSAVIDKQDFAVTVHFPKGQNIVKRTEHFSKIVIPRAKANTSGTNFEIIVGLDLTPAELKFVRSGKKFRLN